MCAPAANASIGSSTNEVSVAKAVASARRRGRTRPDASDLLAVTAMTTRRGRERKTPFWPSKVSVVHVERVSRVVWKWSAEEARVRHGAGSGEGDGEGEGEHEIGGMNAGMDSIFVAVRANSVRILRQCWLTIRWSSLCGRFSVVLSLARRNCHRKLKLIRRSSSQEVLAHSLVSRSEHRTTAPLKQQGANE